MVPIDDFLKTFLRPVFAANRVQPVSDLHCKFALRPYHVCKYGDTNTTVCCTTLIRPLPIYHIEHPPLCTTRWTWRSASRESACGSWDFLGDHLWNGSPYPIGPLSVCLSVCPVLCVTLVYCDQTVGWIKMPLGTEVWPRPRRHSVRWGPSSALSNNAKRFFLNSSVNYYEFLKSLCFALWPIFRVIT